MVMMMLVVAFFAAVGLFFGLIMMFFVFGGGVRLSFGGRRHLLFHLFGGRPARSRSRRSCFATFLGGAVVFIVIIVRVEDFPLFLFSWRTFPTSATWISKTVLFFRPRTRRTAAIVFSRILD